MKYFFAYVAILAVALAAPLQEERDAHIFKYENDILGVDGYRFHNPISRQEETQLKNLGKYYVGIGGSFSYINDEGPLITVNYGTDEMGFQLYGVNLPQA